MFVPSLAGCVFCFIPAFRRAADFEPDELCGYLEYCKLTALPKCPSLHISDIAVPGVKGIAQTMLGLGICIFRSTVTIFVIPKLESPLLHQVLLGGWALADVLRYLALLSQRPFFKLLRRGGSMVLFAAVAAAEVYSTWLVLESLSFGAREWMILQMCVTAVGLPVGSYLFFISAKKVHGKDSEST
ncbi:unnamed protein product [Symbiodinium natans]|uniref:Very-long-chain (3R)-3-hydroxyacyl-CoA dehydratase n=1 Tax=Symbiodinium natans TaxID=878477 RepID=A0A812V8C5_9DINO|nr:unnamed protein product [Symbiodinium natans]